MFDLLIIGSGGAGLSCALEARASGAKVLVVTKSYPTQAQSVMAQGGINAPLGNVEPDSIEAHIEDTLKSANGLADANMVELLCKNSIDTIKWLDKLLVPFSRIEAKTPIKSIAQRKLGGASSARACYAQDYTGLKILHTLYERCLEYGVEFLSDTILLDLISEDRVVKGGVFLSQRDGKILAIDAKATILATGGYGGIYSGYTTNAYGVVGDGLSATLKAGGVLEDMEFIQFHPTALKGSAILISESARGEGGLLIDEDGSRFVDELAPRDEVSRAIFKKISEKKEVFLDLRHIDEKRLKELMPQELHLAKLHANIDATKSLIPIAPVAHYTMGGVATDSNLRAKNLRGLWAVGECSASRVHGANRLGGNSLLEIVTFGRLVAKDAILNPIEIKEQDYKKEIERATKKLEGIFERKNSFNFYQKQKILGKRLYHDLGIIRKESSMREFLEYLNILKERVKETGLSDRARANNQSLSNLLEYESTLLISEAIALTALKRQESRGAHFRSDYPTSSKKWQRHIEVKLEDGEFKLL